MQQELSFAENVADGINYKIFDDIIYTLAHQATLGKKLPSQNKLLSNSFNEGEITNGNTCSGKIQNTKKATKKYRQDFHEIEQQQNPSEQENIFSVASSSANSFQPYIQPQQYHLNNMKHQKQQKRNVNPSSQQSMYVDPKESSMQNTAEFQKNSSIDQQSLKEYQGYNQREVQYSKISTFKRFMTLRDRQEILEAQDNQENAPGEKYNMIKSNTNQSDAVSNINRKIKRIKTQTGESRRGRRSGTDQSSDNGMTLCKISESGLEELSIVQSDALYESEMTNEVIKQYDDRIRQKMQEPSQFMKHGPQEDDHYRGELDQPSHRAPKQRGQKFESSSPRLFDHHDKPQLSNIKKNQSNARFLIQNYSQKRKNPYWNQGQFSVCNSSEYAKLGYSESSKSRQYRNSRKQLQNSQNFKSSNSNDGMSSFNVSVERSQQSRQPKKRHVNKQLVNENAERPNLTDQKNRDVYSPPRIPTFKNQGIPKIPGFKRPNRRESLKNRRTTKELDQVAENEEDEYSPSKGGQKSEMLNFGHVVNQQQKIQNKMDSKESIPNETPQNIQEQISEENQRNDTFESKFQEQKTQNSQDITFDKNLSPEASQKKSPTKASKIEVTAVYKDDKLKFNVEFDEINSKTQENELLQIQNHFQLEQNAKHRNGKNLSVQVPNGKKGAQPFNLQSPIKYVQKQSLKTNDTNEEMQEHLQNLSNTKSILKNKKVNQSENSLKLSIDSKKEQLKMSNKSKNNKSSPYKGNQDLTKTESRTSLRKSNKDKMNRYDENSNTFKKFMQPNDVIIKKQKTQNTKRSGQDMMIKSNERPNAPSETAMNDAVNLIKSRNPAQRNVKTSQENSRAIRQSMKQLCGSNENSLNDNFIVNQINQNLQLANTRKPKSRASNQRTNHTNHLNSNPRKLEGDYTEIQNTETFETSFNKNHSVQNSYIVMTDNFTRGNKQNIKLKNEVIFEQIKNIYYQGKKPKFSDLSHDGFFNNKHYGHQPRQNAPLQFIMQRAFGDERHVGVTAGGVRNVIQGHSNQAKSKDHAYMQYKQNEKMLRQKINNLNQGKNPLHRKNTKHLQSQDAAENYQSHNMHTQSSKNNVNEDRSPSADKYNNHVPAIVNQRETASYKQYAHKDSLQSADRKEIGVLNNKIQKLAEPLNLQTMPYLNLNGQNTMNATQELSRFQSQSPKGKRDAGSKMQQNATPDVFKQYQQKSKFSVTSSNYRNAYNTYNSQIQNFKSHNRSANQTQVNFYKSNEQLQQLKSQQQSNIPHNLKLPAADPQDQVSRNPPSFKPQASDLLNSKKRFLRRNINQGYVNVKAMTSNDQHLLGDQLNGTLIDNGEIVDIMVASPPVIIASNQFS